MDSQPTNMSVAALPKELFIQGLTLDGKPFRPSDWAERLCGVMACFRPNAGPEAHLYYSPYVRPVMIGNLKCVVIDTRLEDIEPAAYRFVLSFAKDNQLQIAEACAIPEDKLVKK